MKKASILGVFAVVTLLPFYALAAVRSEISIDQNGRVTAKNIRVVMISEPGKSTFFYARALWENIYIRLTVLTSNTTVITKMHGEKATIFDIKEGDIINVEGALPNSADTLIIQAAKIVDTSLLREQKEVSGLVTTAGNYSGTFVLKTAKGNVITVNTNGGTSIMKGVRSISASDIAVGDRILSATGTFDFDSFKLAAVKVVVYENKAIFKPKNWSGVLKSISGTTLPVTLSVETEGKTYAVHLNDKAAVLNKARNKVGFQRFVLGDTVRFYGAIRETDLLAIDAEVVRDMNF